MCDSMFVITKEAFFDKLYALKSSVNERYRWSIYDKKSCLMISPSENSTWDAVYVHEQKWRVLVHRIDQESHHLSYLTNT